MSNAILHFFVNFPPELGALFLSIMPLTEKLALIFALTVAKMNPLEAFFLCAAGNMVPITIILLLADKFHTWVQKNSGWFGRTWVKSLAVIQSKFARYQKYELWGLLIFLALPIPINGGVSASLIAFILGVPAQKAWPYLLGGVIISNLITLSVTVGLIRIF